MSKNFCLRQIGTSLQLEASTMRSLPFATSDVFTFLEGGTVADGFIIKQVQVQDDEPVRFDNSASVEARVGVLEEKAVELDRKLRKEVRKSGTWNRR